MFKLSPYLTKVFQNISWLTLDQVIRAIVGILIARYLGITQFGTFNFALAFVSIFAPLVTFGFDSIIIRDLLNHPDKRDEILGSGFFFRFIGAIITFSSCIIIIDFIRPNDLLVNYIVAIVALSYIFQAFDVIDLYFRSQLKSKLSVWSKSPVFLFMNVLKIVCLLMHFPLISFAILYTVEFILGAGGMIWVYKYQLNLKLSKWHVTLARTYYTFREGWPLFLAHVSTFLYTYIDQVLIGVFLGDTSVGGYSASAKIYQMGVVVIMILNTSFFPLLNDLYLRDKVLFKQRYRLISEIYTIISYVIALGVLFFADFGMPFLFGHSFTQSASILKIQMIGFIFTCNGGLRSIYMTITSNQKQLFYTTAISSIMNVILNILLIPFWGVYGSAFATVITQFLSLLFLNLAFKPIRELFFLQSQAFLPILIIRKGLKSVRS